MPVLNRRGDISSSMTNRIGHLTSLVAMIVEAPKEWESHGTSDGKKSSGDLDLVKCTEYSELQAAWRKALQWTEGLDCTLAVMLASITSTRSIGDQLWVKIIGPASCGKSTLCEAISTAKEYILAKSTIRGFHTGFDDGSGKDYSLAAQLNGKTLVTKDGDTLLQSPNLGQILSEGRDLYDTVSRTSYRNRASKDYTGIRMTWLLCGTSSLKSIDQSELGERFLDCVIMDGIDEEMEDQVLWEVANRAERNMSVEADGKPDTHQDADMTYAMQVTGGYVNHLRENAQELLTAIEMPDWSKRVCTHLGKFVAFMRARPSQNQEETAEREFAARLVSQHIRMAKCLAAVMNRNEVDDEVMRRTRKVCMDTARGQTYDICRRLFRVGEEGLELRALAMYLNTEEGRTRKLCRFLGKIKAIESFKSNGRSIRWRLTKTMTFLWSQVIG